MANNLSGISYTNNFSNLDGLSIVQADEIFIDGVPINTDSFVPYNGATANVNLGTFNFQTLGQVTAKKLALAAFESTIMTSPTTSSIFTADSWRISNTVQISSLGSGSFLSTSYLTINDITNNSTLLTFQSDRIANFANTKVRVSTMASNVYDVVNLSTLTNAVAYIEGITSLAFVPYNNAREELNMGASTITTTGRINAGALRITSSISNIDYSLSVNASDQLEITNIATLQTLKTDGASLFIPGNVNCYSGTVFSNDLQLSGTSFLAYGSASQWGTTLNGSGQYEIQDDAGVMRMRLSKTTGMTISTLNITQVASATPTYALGINGGGQVVSFAVPTATNILSLANTFTNTNTFLSTLTAGVGYTTSINGALTTNLDSLGFTSASFTTSGITGTYTAPFGTITNPSGSTYQITQTAAGRSIMAISGFTPSVGITYVFEFNIKCTIGTATISVEQDNILVSPALYPLTTGFNRVVGSFTYNGTPNTVVFKIYTGVASWNAQWDSFTLSTYSIGMNANMNALTVNNRFTQRYNALVTDVSTLVNRATMDSAISATSIVNLNNTFIGTNAFNNDVSLGVSTVVVNQQSITTSILQTAGISSQALGGTAVISGTYLLTPTPTTFAYASVYSPTQTFLANAKHSYLFTGFTAGIFGVSLTVYQANVANTGFVAISSTTPVVVGTFSGIFTPNINSSYLGQVYFTFSGINSKTVGWTTFTYQRGMETVNGNLTVNGDTTLATTTTGNTTAIGNITINNGTAGLLTKLGNTTGYNMTLNGGTNVNSPYIEFFAGGTRRCYMGNVSATQVDIAAENGAQIALNTAGSTRMTIKADGTATHTAGDNSYMKYGPNATWSSNLVVGATPNRVASADTAQVITTNGNLHLDAGNSRDMYYGYYANSNGTPNTHQFYGTSVNFPSGLPQNTTSFSQVAVFDGNTLKRSQAVNRLVYFNNNVAWGGGVNMVNAFYLYNTACNVQIWGKNSGYYSGAGMMQTTIRCYSQSSGAYYYFALNAFVNVGSNHFTVPLNYAASFPYTGWYDIYVYSTSGWITDGNDQLTIGVTVLPAGGF